MKVTGLARNGMIFEMSANCQRTVQGSWTPGAALALPNSRLDGRRLRLSLSGCGHNQ